MTYDQLLNKLFLAYKDARRHKHNTADVFEFEQNQWANLQCLAHDIINFTYSPSPGIAFITEKPVIREIFAAPFRDRVVHHFIYNEVAPWWDGQFIYDNYSCRKGKGTLLGIKRLYHHIASVSNNFHAPAFVLQLDLQGYFMSLNRQKLFEVVSLGLTKQNHPELKLLSYLWRQIIFDDPTVNVRRKGNLALWRKLANSKSLFTALPGCGIVIGNLTSQLLSNIYLNQLDRYITMQLGLKHYGRYVDDFYVVSQSKDQLSNLQVQIEQYLLQLKLTLHPRKCKICNANKGIKFLGAVVYPYRIFPAMRLKNGVRKTEYRYKNAADNNLQYLIASRNSYHGLVQHYKHRKLYSSS